jgi:hypothetical protein
MTQINYNQHPNDILIVEYNKNVEAQAFMLGFVRTSFLHLGAESEWKNGVYGKLSDATVYKLYRRCQIERGAILESIPFS